MAPPSQVLLNEGAYPSFLHRGSASPLQRERGIPREQAVQSRARQRHEYFSKDNLEGRDVTLPTVRSRVASWSSKAAYAPTHYSSVYPDDISALLVMLGWLLSPRG